MVYNFVMRLNSLKLSNFKNYAELSMDFDDDSPIVLIGKNGQGKTNFLQAIVILALSKSFQGVALKEMVNWYSGAEEQGLPSFFRINGNISSKAGEQDLEVFCGKTKKYSKTLKINDLRTKPKDYIGNFRIVLFTPQDLNIIFLSPQLRRRYIDLLISQIDRDYLEHLSSYQVFIKHRNKLLQSIRDGKSSTDQLDHWDEKIALHGSYILWKRREVFTELNNKLTSEYEKISGEPVALIVSWKKDWEGKEVEDFHRTFADYLLEKRQRDIDCGSTRGGPHREDFEFMMDGRCLAESGSRGECRSAILALKLAELNFIKDLTAECPVVLFDDVFSELDEDRQKNLLKLFEADQVFITATHLDFELKKGTIWNVDAGKISST